MKTVELKPVAHNVKIGDVCPTIEPNIIEDTLFVADGKPIGFYLKQVPEKLAKLVTVANAELLSPRVPKSMMTRVRPAGKDENGKAVYGRDVSQFSTILGSCAPKPHLRMPYPRISQVHDEPSASTFVKAMLLACKASEQLIKEVCADLYEEQRKIIEQNVPPKWRFGELFTSSISNFNIAAAYHQDNANLQGCCNVIIAKRHNAKGGNTTIPDYNATVNSSDNSILVYPAWRNVHGVTPIEPLAENGYRNSLVFYPLKAFNKFWD